jgi:hypothetical protein
MMRIKTEGETPPLPATALRALRGLDLGAGVAAAVRRELPVRGPAPAPEEGRPAALLLAMNLLAAGLLLGLVLAGWPAAGRTEIWRLLPSLAATAGAFVVGLALAAGARRLARLDGRIVARLTGRACEVRALDVVLIRAGAAAILGGAALWHLTGL